MASKYKRKAKPVFLKENKRYMLSWLYSQAVTTCTFTKVTEKGFNFIDDEGKKFLKHHLYQSGREENLFFINPELIIV